MGLDYPKLLAELRHESDQLGHHLTALSLEQWVLATPARGWTVHDQVSHLAFFDDCTHLALSNPDSFRDLAEELISGGMDFPDRIAAHHRPLAPEALLNWFTESRIKLLNRLADCDPRHRIPWFGPDMSVASSATARLMETWAHGQDIYDTVGALHPLSPGLRSIAHLGVATMPFAHTLHGRAVPEEPVRVELRAPTSGEVWSWGPQDADNRVCGTAHDFVLVVTQRRHWSETDLNVEGAVARGWLDIAQAFAGAPSRRAANAVPQ